MLHRLTKQNSNLQILVNSIENGDNLSIMGCNIGEKLIILNSISDKFILFVAENEKEAVDVYNKFISMKFNAEILLNYPSLEFNEFENLTEFVTKLQRIKNNCEVLVVTPEILFNYFPQSDYFNNNQITINKKLSFSLDDLVEKLINFGFKKVDIVEDPNTFSVRGDIVDIFTDKPYRIFYDFDDIEKIVEINLVTMLPTIEVDEINIFKNNLLELDNDLLEKELSNLKIKNNDLYEKIKFSLELKKENLWFLPFAKNMGTLYDFLGEDTVVVFNETKPIFDKFKEFEKERNLSIVESIKNNTMLNAHKKQISLDDVLTFRKEHNLLAFHRITTSNNIFKPNRVFNTKTLPSSNYVTSKKLLYYDLQNYVSKGFTVLLYLKNKENVVKYKDILDTQRLPHVVSNTLSVVNYNTINLLPLSFAVGGIFEEEKLVIISTTQLFGEQKVATKLQDNKVEDVYMPEINDFVVHRTHGVGKCLGIQTLNLAKTKKDYVVIEYKNNDKLYLPVENMDSISKFVGSDKPPTLNKLGSSDFSKLCERVKNNLRELSFSLVELYAKREQAKGYKYKPDDEFVLAFENSFGYTETADQITAISDIKKDMEDGKIMDRLVCGDVGFGKTEVALRSAFKTIANGKQVAFLCPTTILSEQHYNTAMSRMSDFGVNIEVINRFKTPSKIKEIYSKAENGAVDMIVGTHAILNKNLNFKNLGLLILDEEQKFGVEDKEKIKNLKNEINVLTLSATPIPRTLHMAMSGIRDISVIETPPTSRINTITEVIEYSDNLLKSAIENEIERDGQVLIIYNKVQSIYKFASHIKSFINSNISIGVAHGQMEEKELENEIHKLYSGETQILVSTTLIENGVDLPNANTLIVINADMLGLSQLYQLKGRIGRSDRQSFAYFTFDNSKILSDNAYKRLQALTEFSSMGSGFKIALRDLEIRGAGNVLGKEQSGNMQKVGYAMYVELLNQAISEVKGEKIVIPTEVKIETDIDAIIDKLFISSYTVRAVEYNKIAKLKNQEDMIKYIENSKNIYGELPLEYINLVKIATIKSLASKVGINKVELKNNKVKLHFDNENRLTENVTNGVAEFNKFAVLKMDKMPIITLSPDENSSSLDLSLNFLEYVN